MIDKYKKEAINNIFKEIQDISVAVIGDFCLDLYLYVDSADSSISLETGLNTKPVHTIQTALGGAGNVVKNLDGLGCKKIYPLGVLGTDLFGTEILKILQDLETVPCKTLVNQHQDWITPSYIKTIYDGVEQGRIDTGIKNEVSDEIIQKILDKFELYIKDIDLVIINQQIKNGIYIEKFIRQINSLVEKNPNVIFVADCRDLQSQFKRVWHKLNTHELAKELGLDPRGAYGDRKNLEQMLGQFSNNLGGDPIILSRGERGAASFVQGNYIYSEGISLLTDLDTVGAGDSFLAGVATSLAAKFPVDQALYIGNCTAAVTIQKLYETGTCTTTELASMMQNADLTYSSEAYAREIAEPIGAKLFSDLDTINERPPIRYAIFDHDGTISTLREGWEEIMAGCMISSITGGQERNDQQMKGIAESVRKLIARTTGIQTINQMAMLVELIKKWDIIPQQQVKSAEEYKAAYNAKLLAHFEHKVRAVAKHLLQPHDLTIVGSIEFLKELNQRGVVIFLASGTDQDDVIREAELLGYGLYFNGRISGSVGDKDNDPKKKVLQAILSDAKIDKREVVVFGDGPVEMREARKNGALAIGICSNEIRRYGWNLAKQPRLISAGAQILIPDFSEYKKLSNFLLRITQ